MKYETARKLKTCVDAIRKQYYEDLKSKEMRIRQRCVAGTLESSWWLRYV